MAKVVDAITDYTANFDWPQDDPMRVGKLVIRSQDIPPGSYLLCSYDWEHRRPPPPGDYDVHCQCAGCNAGLLKRKSAPNLPTYCHICADVIKRNAT
jgi:hypothetical protein